ncbi:hypothetical protein BGX31_002192 [Mortierella sp. GBA43]|nr:hypothetical protein BGX31_002192 [Mortierella sp. GBA43]
MSLSILARRGRDTAATPPKDGKWLSVLTTVATGDRDALVKMAAIFGIGRKWWPAPRKSG